MEFEINDVFTEALEIYKFEEVVNSEFFFSFKDFNEIILLKRRNSLKEQLANGYYIYVNGTICLNKPEFIKTNNNGKFELTRNALNNLSACCVVNLATITLPPGMELGECGAYIRYEDVFDDSHTLDDNIEKYKELFMNFPNTFNEAIVYLMKIYNYQNLDLAVESGLDESVISKMRNKQTYSPKLESIIYICIAMKLLPSISFKLISLAGINLTDVKEEHIVAKLLLYRTDIVSIEDAKKYFSELS
ncbi:hypothetical protein MXZ21_07675 [Streptococcus uberis]|uniref:hypothetical protein n=1 Tax=Streptococcus uberis TaxID=1349 RepID=UPI001FF10B7E|nr:hypothetical protein [Streptococcus uberis]MCK1191656.1 hypothetical protein [Streptococcus uberis]MCK1209454.1 hypothetical protein [Streptococcus uberis]